MIATLGAPAPLGVTLTPSGVNVAVYSANASAVWFCLYDGAGEHEIGRAALHGDGEGVFCGAIEGVGAGARYGLRCEGPFDPARGHRFDASKLLCDPYSAWLDRPFALHPSMSARGVDSGPDVPKSIILSPPPSVAAFTPAPWSKTILYELNLRGFTHRHPDIPEAARGRFRGLAHPAAVAHLKRLGVTSVEIMPADACIDERHLPPLGLTNAWGYNPVIFGAPDPRLAPGGWEDVRAATDALHAAGIEAILDIVLNHNGESDEFGPTLSFRGLDNASYFRLNPADPSRYINDMGCGNCLALDRAPVMDVAIAALRRWVAFGGIDGFRFDLASALGRRANGFDPHAPLLARIAADPILAKTKLIAEPWDIGPGGYQLGRFPLGWGEWNDKFRDAARRFWRGDLGLRGEFATRLSGSSDIFAQSPAPSKSVNFVTAHDGFTLADLVAYNHKHNDTNGEDNRDGANENFSWNNGAEGPSDDPAIRAARARDQRNLLAALLLSRGAPMLAMGCELGHSQQGNNNAYAQDNAISWINWAVIDAKLLNFTQKLIAFRQAHPAVNADHWLSGRVGPEGLADVEWRDANAPLASAAQWEDGEGQTLVAILAAAAPDGVERVALVFHRAHAESRLSLPEPRDGKAWRMMLDTCDDDAPQRLLDEGETPLLRARSTMILVESAAPERRAELRPPEAAAIDALAAAAGIAGEWWDVAGKHTLVSLETKKAILASLRLPSGSVGQARDSLKRLLDDTAARRVPSSLVLRSGAPMTAPLRADAHAPERAGEIRIETERGEVIETRDAISEARLVRLVDGREIIERLARLPDLPEGRHKLFVDGTPCALTIAPPRAYRAPGAERQRFGFAAQLYAQRRRQNDQGIGDFTALSMLGEAAGQAGAATLGFNPLHVMFPSDRRRASPYQPSDRRFLDPIYIDALDAFGLPEDDTLNASIAASAEAIRAASAASALAYDEVWRVKRRLLEARFAAFERARAANPREALFAGYDAYIHEGGESLSRFAIYQALEAERVGQGWRDWPQALRDAEPAALKSYALSHAQNVNFACFLQWLAERQLSRASERVAKAGLEFGFYRDLAVGAAPDGAEAWSRAGELAVGVSVGAPPDPFSAQGQIWNLPAPDPIACAKDGWRNLSAVYAANMRHAGLLRIDHAMGLTRLFVAPDGAKPADGTYIAYPLNDLIGQITLESQRHRCMIAGEDLGTVPDGFRQTMAEANFLGTRVLWFERAGLDFLEPQTYPALSIACATTHDLPTLAGWWAGADIAERLSLNLIRLDEAQSQIAERLAERRALTKALQRADALKGDPDFDAPLSDEFAAAAYAYVGQTHSQLALAQLDDLAGESVATNLPGTDKERANWRHRLAIDVETIMTMARAQAIIERLADGRR